MKEEKMLLIIKHTACFNLAWQWIYLTDKTGFLFIGTHCIGLDYFDGFLLNSWTTSWWFVIHWECWELRHSEMFWLLDMSCHCLTTVSCGTRMYTLYLDNGSWVLLYGFLAILQKWITTTDLYTCEKSGLANRGAATWLPCNHSQQPIHEWCLSFVCVRISIVILVTNLPENSCMCSCELHRLSLQRMGTNILPINTIVMGHIWIYNFIIKIPTPECKHVLVVSYVRTHVFVGLCLSQ